MHTTKNRRDFKAVAVLAIIELIALPLYVFAAPPDSPYDPGETLAPLCNPLASHCTVKTFITSLGDPNQVLMMKADGTGLEYRSPDSSMVPENGNLYFTEDRVWDFISDLINNPDGLAGLDGSGKIPLSIIPDALIGSVSYKGSWDASANSPALASGTGEKGDYYVVNNPGSTDIDGTSSWDSGDWIIFNGTAWEKVTNSHAVSSVNGQTGEVELSLSDLGIDVPIDVAHGGTGLSSVQEGDLFYGSDGDALSALSAGTDGQVLKMSGGVPVWGADLTSSGGGGGETAAGRDHRHIVRPDGPRFGIERQRILDHFRHYCAILGEQQELADLRQIGHRSRQRGEYRAFHVGGISESRHARNGICGHLERHSHRHRPRRHGGHLGRSGAHRIAAFSDFEFGKGPKHGRHQRLMGNGGRRRGLGIHHRHAVRSI